MKLITVITGAGWDPVTEAHTRAKGYDVPERVPEMFWQFDSGVTVLERQARQFRSLGAEQVFVGTGKPGCSPVVTEDNNREVYGVELPNYGASPWTQGQVDYITGLDCVPLLMPDPHAKGENCWTTLLRMAPVILDESWDRVVISAGDYIFRSTFLKGVLDTEWPEQFWFFTKHSMELLTRDAFVAYTDYLRGLSNKSQAAVWLHRADNGLPQFVWGTREKVFGEMAKHWTEVDPHSWGLTLELARQDPVCGG